MYRWQIESITNLFANNCSRRSLVRLLGGGLAASAALGGLGLAHPERAGAKTRQRPIADFVDAQGTFCIPDGAGGCFLFVPPLANFLGWATPSTQTDGRGASFDYAGIAARYLRDHGVDLGTETSGKISERELADGSVRVSVELHTSDALSWAINLDPNAGGNPFGDNPLIFGYRVPEVLAGKPPAVGSSQFHLVFDNPAPGEPLPDVLELLITRFGDLRTLSFRARATGDLRSEFGVAEGTRGHLTVSQTGIQFGRDVNPNSAVADRFPAEIVNVKRAGH